MSEKYIQTELEGEKQRRICIALWAYAYEMKSDPIVDDAKFDEVCKEIDITKSTDDVTMDIWFSENFQPHTGQWIHKYPNVDKLENIYKGLKNK